MSSGGLASLNPLAYGYRETQESHQNTRVMQLKYGPPQKSSNMTLLRENSLNAVSLGRQIVLPTGVLLLPIEQANKQ